MKSRIYILFIILILFTLLTACTVNGGTKDETNDNEMLTIYTTVFPLKDFSEKIGGKFVKVESVYPPNVDEHTFEPSQKDMIDLAESDLFFYIGHGLEPFVKNAETILTDEGVTVVAIGEKVNLVEEHLNDEHNEEKHHDHEHDDSDNHDEHHHGPVDPHLWIDPIYAKEMAQVITQVLSEAMPEQKAYFEENLLELEGEFDKLDEEFKSLVNTSSHDTIIVSHAAFNYWEKRYGIHQLSIAGISTSDEPSQKELTKIIDEVNHKGLQYILVEQNISSKLVEVVSHEAGLETLPIHNLATLTNEEIEKEEDYFSLMYKNLDSLKKALNP